MVTAESPVDFHEHKHGHWLTCCNNIMDVETEHQGRIRMMPGELLWVDAHEKHKLTAPCGPVLYTCIGKEGL